MLNTYHDEECYWWKNEHQDIQKLYLVHRLDSPTSGVILATSDLKIAHAIKESFLTKKVKKTYFAIDPSLKVLLKRVCGKTT